MFHNVIALILYLPLNRPFLTFSLLMFSLISVFLFWFIPPVYKLSWDRIEYSPYEEDGVTRYSRVVGPAQDSWVPLDAIDDRCQKALIVSEDSLFFDHAGVDFAALGASANQLLIKGVTKRGGSSLTQQLVKNLFLSRDRSLKRKAREITGALLVSKFASKKEELAWYFNAIEFGPKVYGIEHAARYYYGSTADKLSFDQCLSLIAIIPSPLKWGLSLKQKNESDFIIARKTTLLEKLGYIKAESSEEPSDPMNDADKGASQLGQREFEKKSEMEPHTETQEEDPASLPEKGEVPTPSGDQIEDDAPTPMNDSHLLNHDTLPSEQNN